MWNFGSWILQFVGKVLENLFILKKIICACICIHVYTDVEAETLILWPPDAKSWLIGKDPDAGKDWEQEEKEVTEDETVDGMTDSMNMSLSKLGERVKDRES